MPDTEHAVALLDDDQRFLFEGLLSAYVQNKLSSHFHNPRTKRLRPYVLIGESDWAYISSFHLLGFTSLHQLKSWVDGQFLCRSFYEPRGFHLEVGKTDIGEDEYGDLILVDAIYLVPNESADDLPSKQ